VGPGRLPDHQLPYDRIVAEIAEICSRYQGLTHFTTDQYGFMLLPLLKAALQGRMGRAPRVTEVPTTGPSKRRRWERTKAALGMGWVHIPEDGLWADGGSLVKVELKYLQRRGDAIGPPTIGPVQTDDGADALSHVTSELIGDEVDRRMLWDALEEAPFAFGGRGGWGTQFEPGSATSLTVERGRGRYRGSREALDEFSRAMVRSRGMQYMPGPPPTERRRGRP